MVLALAGDSTITRCFPLLVAIQIELSSGSLGGLRALRVPRYRRQWWLSVVMFNADRFERLVTQNPFDRANGSKTSRPYQ